jgi:hypothetical protein
MMSRTFVACILYAGTLLAVANPLSAGEFEVTHGDAYSNALQDQIDDEDISQGQAAKEIEKGDFDSSEGGLYCPNNNCEDDPSDAANGF